MPRSRNRGRAFKRPPPPPAGGGKSRGPAGRGLSAVHASPTYRNFLCFPGLFIISLAKVIPDSPSFQHQNNSSSADDRSYVPGDVFLRNRENPERFSRDSSFVRVCKIDVGGGGYPKFRVNKSISRRYLSKKMCIIRRHSIKGTGGGCFSFPNGTRVECIIRFDLGST